MRKLCLIGYLFFMSFSTHGQTVFCLEGNLFDENNQPLSGASVMLSPTNKSTVTDRNGHFRLEKTAPGKYRIHLSYVGYEPQTDTIVVDKNLDLTFALQPQSIGLQEVVVKENYADRQQRETPLNVETVSKSELRQHFSGSLMTSLEQVPGISVISIGSGNSKPLIRGLGFNRVMVTENGIKHEAQQWGADHGLEIDRYAVENVEIIKGPASLRYGSDAIGGVINLKGQPIPGQQSFGGEVNLTGMSNNDYVGGSVQFYFRKKLFFADFRASIADYADYKVPTDYISIYSYKVTLHNHRLRNTAGKEQDYHLSFGWAKAYFSTRFYVSDIAEKSGFFANAHGLEPRNVNTLLHDISIRDILYPYQTANHLKVINETRWGNDISWVNAHVGFQRNFRNEYSSYTAHGYMPDLFPDTLGFASDLERQFDKTVYTVNADYNRLLDERTQLSAGVNTEYQQNTISGYGFIFPAYRQFTAGLYVLAKHTFSEKHLLQVGARYDFGQITTEAYSDWFPSPVVTNGDTAWLYLQRSSNIKRCFSNVTWSVGYNFNIKHWQIKAHIGKSFRMPSAKELAANGVNYHHYSYEVGDSTLSAESSYQLDLSVNYSTKRFGIELTPFVNYFPNYIYLNPTSEYDRLYGNGNQVYRYTQAQVFRYGMELHGQVMPIENLKLAVTGNYLYSVQLSGAKKGYTLPFSPPASLLFSVGYDWKSLLKWLPNIHIGADYKLVAAQHHIVPPEEPTDGYQTVSVNASCDFKIKNQTFTLSAQVRNLLNATYYNHTNFYRLINVPEAGRNFIVNLSFPFSGQIKNKHK